MAVFASALFSRFLQPRAPQASVGAGVTFFIPFATIAARFQQVHRMQHRANDDNGLAGDLLVAIFDPVLVVVIALGIIWFCMGVLMMSEVTEPPE
jgi:hypothetical protein